jgi:hypothetical protein
MRSQLRSISLPSLCGALAGTVTAVTVMLCGTTAFAATHSEFVRSFPLPTLTTFAFRDQHRAAGDPLEGNPIWISDIEGVIRQDLKADGKTEAEIPDFYVAFYVEVGDRYNLNIDYGTTMREAGALRGDRAPGGDLSVIPYKTSMIVVDVIDARSNQLVWRGYDSNTFSARDPDKTLGQAAHDVMARLERDLRNGKW